MSSTITREQFASAVASAISSVHHLYREVDRLMSGLRDRLADEPDSLSPVSLTFAKAGRDQTRVIVRNEYSALFAPTVSDDEGGDEDEEEFDEEGDETEDEDTGVKKSKRAPAEIAANVPLLAVRIVMYDPQKRDSLEPQIQYAAMSEWTVGKGPCTPEQRFQLRRNMLRRIPKALASGVSLTKGARLITKARVKSAGGAKKGEDRLLGCRLPTGIETVALYTLDTAEGLDHLVQHMKTMWNESVKKT
jgi:hypothetical protein